MEMNTDRDWLLSKAAQEDGCMVSAGGLVSDKEKPFIDMTKHDLQVALLQALRDLRETRDKLAVATEDGQRLDALEKLVADNRGGLLLHHQQHDIKWTGVGIGLSHRPLRKAIDQATPAGPDPDVYPEVCSVIAAAKALRHYFAESQQAFATRLGISIRSVAHYEKDRIPVAAVLRVFIKAAHDAAQEDLADVFRAELWRQTPQSGRLRKARACRS